MLAESVLLRLDVKKSSSQKLESQKRSDEYMFRPTLIRVQTLSQELNSKTYKHYWTLNSRTFRDFSFKDNGPK